MSKLYLQEYRPRAIPADKFFLEPNSFYRCWRAISAQVGSGGPVTGSFFVGRQNCRMHDFGLFFVEIRVGLGNGRLGRGETDSRRVRPEIFLSR